MKEDTAKTIARILCSNQVSKSKRDALCGREAIFPIKDHAVAAIEHQHRRTGTLILRLMHMQIRVLEVERQRKPFPLQCREKGLAHVKIQRVPELVRLGPTADVDPGSQI